MMPILVNLWSAIGLRSPLPAYRSYEAGMVVSTKACCSICYSFTRILKYGGCIHVLLQDQHLVGSPSYEQCGHSHIDVTMKQEEEEVVLHSPWEAVQRLKLVDNMIRRQLDIDNLSASGM